MGEATPDTLMGLNRSEALLFGAVCFAAASALQFSVKQYLATPYWLLVAAISIFGTMAADFIHYMGVPVYASTSAFGIALLVVFWAWYAGEKTLDFHQISVFRREVFYWATVFVSFSFGTAAGDWTAGTLHLGNFYSGVLFLALFILPAIGFWKFGLNGVVSFWFATS